MSVSSVARPVNWLPIPGERLGSAAKIQEIKVDENDLFTKGEVVSFYPLQNYGSVRGAHGEMLPFSLPQIELIGPKGKKHFIAVGGRVGYDVARTSDGPHIVKMKVY